jgi:lon-related putative ATP-dependent protease
MPQHKELKHKELTNKCSIKLFEFRDTSKINAEEGIIGQQRASDAMEFGLSIRAKGYNIYMCGPTGTGKTTYARNCAVKVAQNEKVPDDWCYIYNFEKPNEPVAVNLQAGKGKEFKQDIDELVDLFKTEIPKVFESEEYEKGKAEKIREYQKKRAELLEKLNNNAEEKGFKVKTSGAGIFFLPIIEGRELSEDEYEKLDPDAKKDINEKSRELQNATIDIIRQVKGIDRDVENEIDAWENELVLSAIGGRLEQLAGKYKNNEKILVFLDKIKADVLANLDEFREDSSEAKKKMVFPWLDTGRSIMDKYSVNLIVDNSDLKGAPVIEDYNPTYFNLLGRAEYENYMGTLTTNYKMIKEGLIHKANGGYLILQAKDVLSNYQSWDALKRVLKTGEVHVGNIREQISLVSYATLKPEPIQVDLKVILIGNEYIYQLLYHYDEDFGKLFKIKVDFDTEMERNHDNILRLASFIAGYCNKENLKHFDRSGVARVVEYSSRLAEHKYKLVTRFSEIAELITEASTWADIDGSRLVKRAHVEKAIYHKKYRSDKYDKRIQELLQDGTIMIDTEGQVVGQINGLSILDTGDYRFGKPSRITAATYMGEKGIVNIEREIELSGKLHSKGVLILSGYIGQKYAQEMPLTLTASITFEQTYGGIEGDSASCAELYAILSSLAEVPIKQGIAVTGSVNQKGEVQPIGGVNDKIEGFFELCRYRGLTGEHGVIIPHQNVRNLMLSDDVVQAVKEGKFHIYAIKTIDEGIFILTGIKAGERNSKGKYPKGSVNYLVDEKLRSFARLASSSGKK